MSNVVNADDRLVDADFLANRWLLSRESIYVKINRRDMPIPVLKLGRLVRFKMSDVLAHEAASTIAPASATRN